MHTTLPAGQAVRINSATRPPTILACNVFVYECGPPVYRDATLFALSLHIQSYSGQNAPLQRPDEIVLLLASSQVTDPALVL